MYIPAAFRVSEEATILSFIERYDFSTIVTSSASDGMVATHVPVLVKRDGDRVVLQGHVARANEHWRSFDGRTQALAIFHGPHGYVSPTWYAGGDNVPTWNYAVVHAYGRPRLLEDAGAARRWPATSRSFSTPRAGSTALWSGIWRAPTRSGARSGRRRW